MAERASGGHHILSEARSDDGRTYVATLRVFADNGHGEPHAEALWEESKGEFASEHAAHDWAVSQGEHWIQNITLH